LALALVAGAPASPLPAGAAPASTGDPASGGPASAGPALGATDALAAADALGAADAAGEPEGAASSAELPSLEADLAGRVRRFADCGGTGADSAAEASTSALVGAPTTGEGS